MARKSIVWLSVLLLFVISVPCDEYASFIYPVNASILNAYYQEMQVEELLIEKAVEDLYASEASPQTDRYWLMATGYWLLVCG